MLEKSTTSGGQSVRTTLADINGIARFSDDEWQQIISHLTTGTIFDKANILRDKLPVKFDDGSSRHIYFLSDDPTQNRYQISNQLRSTIPVVTDVPADLTSPF